jgi:hypothetical protein
LNRAPAPTPCKLVIASMADAAAREWVTGYQRDLKAPKPPNPFNKEVDAEHFQAWAVAFERFLVLYSCAECGASA